MAQQPSIVITGASTGIGYALVQRFTQGGWRVFGSVRKQADGDRLHAETGAVPLLFDVVDDAAIQAAAATVADALAGQTLSGLVNNAGVAIAGPLLYIPMEEVRQQMDINLLGPARVTQAFAPLLGADRTRQGAPGRIAQMSSVAGRFGVPFLGPYVASKHALEGMSESLRRELMLFGIGVSVIAPGAIVTPIWDKAEMGELSSYGDTPYGGVLPAFRDEMIRRGRLGLPVERVADVVWHAMTAKKPKVRYEVIPNRFRDWTVPKLLPTRMVDRAMAKMIGLVRK